MLINIFPITVNYKTLLMGLHPINMDSSYIVNVIVLQIMRILDNLNEPFFDHKIMT